MSQDFISIEEAAEYLGLPLKTLGNLATNKSITYYKIAKRRKFKKEDLDAYLLAACRPAKNATGETSPTER
jgi:excisionase family DNA binding protein